MIGHCALFTEGGYLHRDVSDGTIMLLPKTMKDRKIPARLSQLQILLCSLTSVIDSMECTAVLIDGDAARNWSKDERPSRRYGTRPFISTRVARQALLARPASHYPTDDLRSFIWVLLHCLIRWSTKLTPKERLWWNALNSDEFDILYHAKLGIVVEWTKTSLFKNPDLPPTLLPFRDLLHDLFTKADFYEDAILSKEHSLTNLAPLFDSACKAFVQILERHIYLLPVEFPDATM
ncbi:hypothetical protein BDN71DRAFT_1164456 [Pleurotus eryngii]|uniref:Fungal-type protein kinase domain-containing protein n=1 Tax=Pleurotus eryngii TaxID=5323 RepID=A0A9P5ZUJ3_PLEER|nr:hypothetical protein BDN71DRAFT_1164456 [Pleurotus eryngii]